MTKIDTSSCVQAALVIRGLFLSAVSLIRGPKTAFLKSQSLNLSLTLVFLFAVSLFAVQNSKNVSTAKNEENLYRADRFLIFLLFTWIRKILKNQHWKDLINDATFNLSFFDSYFFIVGYSIISPQDQESILPNFDFFIFPIFAIKLGNFKLQTIFSHAANTQA